MWEHVSHLLTIYLCVRFYIEIWSGKVTTWRGKGRQRSVKDGKGERFAAEAGLGGGRGRLRLRAMQGALAQHLAHPATSDEVRQIPESTLKA